MQPPHTALNELLHFRFQLGLVQMEIVHGTNAQNARSRERRADAVHERPAGGAEIVGHVLTRSDRARLAEGGQLVPAAEVLQVRIGDDKVGREHGRGDFMAIGAIADEAGD